MNRTESIAEIAAQSSNEHDFSFRLRDFLDGFYLAPRPSSLADEPRMLASVCPEGERLDSFLAAVAEHLALQLHFPIPTWVWNPGRILQQPYFAFDTYEGRMFLLADSPTAFRARNIFVGADALSRV